MRKFLLNLLFMALMVPWVTQAQEISEYLFSETTTTYTSIASTGANTGLSLDDEAVQVTLPFTFPFGMESYTSVYITSNGQIGLNADPVASAGAYDVSVYTGNYSMIVPLGHDLNPAQGGTVYVDSLNSSVFTVEWDSIRPFTGYANTYYCFQVKLYPSGDIEMIYGPMVVGTSQNDVVVRVREYALNNVINITGTWNNASISMASAVSNRVIDSAAHPIEGTVYSFTRPIITCPRPSSISISGITQNSVSLTWVDTVSTSSTWDIAYGPQGFNPNDMETTEIGILVSGLTEDTITIGGLSFDTVYDFYVRADCGGDYSTWRGVASAKPGTIKMGVTGSANNTGCGFTIVDDGGTEGNYSNSCNYSLTIYPSSQDSLVVITGGTLIAESIDKLTFYDGASTSSPVLTTIPGSGSSTVVNIPQLISTNGPITINFYSDGSVVYGGFEISTSCIAVPVCSPVRGVEIVGVAGRSAMVSWAFHNGLGGAPAQSEVEVINLDDNTIFSSENYVTDTRFLIQGLTPQTNYRVRVRSICEDESVTEWDSIDFETPCLAGGNIEIADGTTSTSYFPTYTFYDYSYSQQLFEASEMNGATTLYEYSFYVVTGGQTRDLDIYLGETSQTTLTASTYIRDTSLTLVYSGPHTFVQGWNTIVFDSAFNYSGQNSLVLAIDDNSGTYVSSMTYRGHSASGKALYSYRDGTNISPASPNTFYTSSTRGNVIFTSPCDSLVSCVPPAVYVTTIDGNSFDIVWAAGNEESTWNIDIKELGDSDWTNVVSNTNNNEYSFTDMSYSTTYQVRVTANCGGGEEASAIISIYISCPPITELPFTENFDSWASGSTAAIDSCWNRLSDYVSGSSQYPYVSTSYSLSSNKSVYMYSTATTYSALILPPFATSIDSLQITFGLFKTTTGSYPIQVGVMVDPSDISTFTAVATVDASQGYRWQMFEIPLNGYTGSGKYIALVSPNGTSSYPYLDNVEVNLIPTCPRVYDVEVSGITQTSAYVSWSDTTEAECIVEYGPAGFTPGTGTFDNPIPDTNLYQIQNLTSNTEYDVYVYRVCDDADTSNPSFIVSFHTACDPFTIPFSESFETWTASSSLSSTIDPCWNRMSTYSSSSAYPYVSSSYALDGSKSVYMYSTNTSYSILSLPSFTTPIDSLQISFGLYKTNTSYTHEIHVGVMTDPNDISTFVPIDTVAASALSNWEMFEIPLSSYTGTGGHIALVSPNGAYSYPYLDNVQVDIIPTCPRPRDVVSVGTHSDTIVVDWTEFGSATEWQICYGPSPIDPTLGQGTMISGVYSHPYTIPNLSNDTIYDVYVRSICGPGDTSYWAFSHVTTAPGSYNMPLTGIDTIYMCSGWIYDDGGPNGNYGLSANGTLIIYPSSPLNVVSITGSYDGESCCDYLRIYDGAGTVGTIELYNDYGDATNLSFESTTGPLTIQFTSDGSVAYGGFAFNVQCISNTCPRVQDLTATYVTNTMAVLDWTETGPATEWEIAYDTLGFDVEEGGGNRMIVNAHPCTLNYLTPMTRYDVYVRGVCGAEDSAGWRQITVTTGYCDTPVINEISDSIAGTTYMYPFNSFYNYSYTQQIYYPGEIDTLESGIPMDISSLAFQYFFATPEPRQNVEIYLGHTTDSVFAATSSWIDDSMLTKVFEGDIDWNNEGNDNWFEIQLDTVFTYNNTDNLVVVMLDGTGDYSNSTAKLYTHTTGINNAMEYHTDGSPINMASPSNGTRHTYRSNIRFISCDPCSMPSGASVEPGATTAVVTFPTVGNYEIGYKETEGTVWSDNISVVNTNTYTVTGLQPETNYEFRLRTVCDSTTLSGWFIIPITTLELPCVAPMGFSTSNVALTSATVAWTDSLNNQEAWKVAYGYGADASAWDTIEVTTASVNLTDLYSNTEYTVYVKAYCSVEANVTSDWSAAFTFRTATCEGVSNITASAVTTNSATINWTPGASQTKWEISYGMEGISEANGTKVVVENTPAYTIEGLESDLTYDVYVRTVCEEGVYSAWSNKIQFRTTVGINTASADNVKVQIYPNPANSEATISVDGVNGKVEFVVADMNGRMVVTETINCEGSLVKTIDVSNLAKGAYFVHIYNDNFNTTRKLIVK